MWSTGFHAYAPPGHSTSATSPHVTQTKSRPTGRRGRGRVQPAERGAAEKRAIKVPEIGGSARGSKHEAGMRAPCTRSELPAGPATNKPNLRALLRSILITPVI